MKTSAIVVCATLAMAGASSAETQHRRQPTQAGAPPSLLLASPGLFQSGNECAPDRPEATWSLNHEFLGYSCVRNPSNR